MSTFARLAAFCVLVFSLTACGGGGGGGGGGVSISLVSPNSVNNWSYAGMSPNAVDIKIRYSGNVATLNGRTLYIVVEVPDALYEARPVYYIDTATSTFNLTLNGKLLGVAEGRYQNTMKIYACLDPACSSQLGGSPISIPYDVEVRPSLSLSPDMLNLTTPYGTQLAPSEVQVNLPQGLTAWNLLEPTGGTISFNKAGSGNKIIVTPAMAQPGTYMSTAYVTTYVTMPNSGIQTAVQKSLTVNYTVTPSSVAYVMNPTSASYTFTQNNSEQRHEMVYLDQQNSGGSFSLRGISYTSNPVAANAHSWVNQWLYNSMGGAINSYSVIPCDFGQIAPNGCLPAGTYTGAMLYRHTSSAGVISDFEFPVTMTINP